MQLLGDGRRNDQRAENLNKNRLENLMSNENIQYADEFINRLEILWGEGFLSPGGADEVKLVLKDIDLNNKSILDIGCGTGGVEVVLAGKFDIDRVTGIDVEPQLVERTQKLVDKKGLSAKVKVELVDPGPLDFANNEFDIVFSKDSMIHIPDKNAIFSEILRVLKPGGVFAASDWLVGENADSSPEWARVRNLSHLDFKVFTAAETELAMRQAGFEQVSTLDRNAWYASNSATEYRQLEGPLRERILEVADEEVYEHWMKVRRAFRDSAAVGALRPTHLRGYKARD
jgi:phosphoethanolamine N-methyltransferase